VNRTLQLQQDRAALIDGIKLIGETAAKTGRVFSAEELVTIDSKHKEVEAINATLSAEQRMAALSNIPTDRSPIHGGLDMHENELDKPLFGRPAVKGETYREKMLRLASGMGEQLMAVRNAALQPHATDSRLLEMQKRSTPQGASEQIPADGGFLVYPDFANEIFKIMHDVGLVYPRAMKIPLSETTNAIKIPGVDEQSRANGSRWGGVQMFWQNEADSLTGSKPKFRLIELVTKKLTGLFYATDELLADSRALGAIVLQAFGEEMAFKMDDALIRGTGAGMPMGLLNAPALITISKESGQATQTIVYENIKKMWGRVWNRSRPNAVWFINQDIEQQLYGMVQTAGTGGIPVYLPAGVGGALFGGAAGAPLVGGAGSPYGLLFGRPVIPIEQCSTLGTLGDIFCADLSQYVYVDKGDMQAASSMHVRFVTDEMTFRWIYRVDGQPLWHTPLTPYQGSNTLSPFITLAAR
jgi:HK97 family phage major capsid protein